MRVGTKLAFALALPILLLIAGFGYLDIRRSGDRFRNELRREGRTITRTVQLAIEDALRDRQLSDIQLLVDEVSGFERVFGLRLFDRSGRMTYQSENLISQTFTSRKSLEQVLATREPAETRRIIDGEWVLTFIVPLKAPDGSVYGALQLLQLESFVKEEAHLTRNSIIGLTIAIIIVAGLTLFLVTHIIVARPVRDLIRNVRALQLGTRSTRLTIRGGDELARLAQEFNTMVERLESAHASLLAEQHERRQAELRFRNAERLAALGQLAAGLAHEIGTPLNVIGGRTDLLMRKQPGGELLERNLRVISEQINRITRIVREMLGFARIAEPKLAMTDVTRILHDVVGFLEYRLENARIRVHASLPEDLPRVPADPDQIYEVFLNLILNAMDAMAPEGSLRIAAERITRAHPDESDGPAEFLAIHFEDDGEGIPPENLERVFDPFFTTKGAGRGSGLGLSVSYGIVREHRGWIDVGSGPGRGTMVTVFLPLEGPRLDPVRRSEEGIR